MGIQVYLVFMVLSLLGCIRIGGACVDDLISVTPHAVSHIGLFLLVIVRCLWITAPSNYHKKRTSRPN